jgi:hypothetical protein
METAQRQGGFQAAKEGWLKLCASYPNLSGADCAVAIALSTYFNSKTRNAWPSFERLAADTILIIKRRSSGVVQYARGRDIEESETAMQFSKSTCR